MFCHQCGTPATEAAKYCTKCGIPLLADNPNSAVAASAAHPETQGPRSVWMYLLGLFLVGTYSAVLIPALAGEPPQTQHVFGCMLWTSVFMWLWWTRRGRKGWQGAVIGIGVGLLSYVALRWLGLLTFHSS
jgi:hypothetical protein